MLPGGIELKSKRINPLQLPSLSGLTSILGKEPKLDVGLFALIYASSLGRFPGGIPI